MPRARRTSIEGSEEQKGMGGGILILIVLIIIGAVVVSLLSGGPGTAKPQTNNDVVAQSLEQLTQIKKESFTFDGGLEAKVSDGYQGVKFSGVGQVDSETKKMHFDMTLESDTFKDGALDLETYTTNDEMYIKFQNQWTKGTAPIINWDNSLMSTKVMQFVDQFDTPDAKVETISGKEAYRFDINPSMSEIFTLMQSVNPSALEGLGITSPSGLGQGIKDITVTVWVDTETMLPVKMDVLINAKTAYINPKTGSGVETTDIVVSGTITFDYSDNINIVIPSAAQAT